MFLDRQTFLPLLYFLFTFFDGLKFTCCSEFPGTSCFPDRCVAFHDFDNSFAGQNHGLHSHTYVTWDLKLWKLILYFGRWNAFVTGFIIVITLLNIAVYKLRQLKEGNLGEKNEPWCLSSELLCRRFSFAEIELATHNFDEAFVIGKGGFGKVYKGLIDHGKRTVAIKRLDSKSKQGASEFWTEINMLSKFRHCHLVSLIGYCDEYPEKIVVYEHMPSGNLNDRLHKIGRSRGETPLSWVRRLKICIGTARALDYLHTGIDVQHRVIHRDIKSSNILLDENLAAKVSDFGVAKIGAVDQPYTHVTTEVKGSFGYFDPHYFLTRKLTRKSDVYAFGVILFEVLCGRPAVDLTLDEEQQSLSRWAQHCVKDGMSGQIIDPNLRGQIAPDCLMAFLQIADQCLEHLPKKRPTMAEVVIKLESAMAMQERHDSSSTVRNHDRTTRSSDITCGQLSLKSDRIVTFSRMLPHFFSVKAQLNSGNAKPSRKKKSNNKGILDSVFPRKDLLPNNDGGVTEEVPLSRQIATLNLKVFTFADLESSTMNFCQDLVLGKGGFGTVYKGWVDEKTYAPSKIGVGMPIAIKRHDSNGFQGHDEWLMEVKILGGLRHPNLVKLLGFCEEDKELILVFEYMPKGSLENYMFKKGLREPLPWTTLLKIMIGAARGLAFLHHKENRVIYRDFKSDNILMDQDFNGKLADFGLAKLGVAHGETHISTCVMGTWGYAAPEYIATGHLSLKNDIYGFGVVLLEILTGLRVHDESRSHEEQNLVDWARPLLPKKRKLKTVMDPRLLHDCPSEGAFKYAALVLKCIDHDPKKRPQMEEVLQKLEQISAIKMKRNDGSSSKVSAFSGPMDLKVSSH